MRFWESGCDWIGKLRLQRVAAIALMTMVIMSVLVTSAFATDTADDTTEFMSKDKLYWGICLGASLAALAQAWVFFRWMMARDEGNETMVELAGHVRDGASAYLTQQYKVVIVFFCYLYVLVPSSICD
jgi:hypothetical protein